MPRQIKSARTRVEAMISVAGLSAFALLFLQPLRQAVFGSQRVASLTVALGGAVVLLLIFSRRFFKRATATGSRAERNELAREEQRLRSFNLNTLEPVGNERGAGAFGSAHDPRGGNNPLADANANALSAATIIVRLRAIGWAEFERVVAFMYERLGYSVTCRDADEARNGIDLVLEKDGERTAVQCKQWRGWKTPQKTVGDFAAVMAAAGMSKGVFVVLGGSPDAAIQLAEERGIEVLDEGDLAQMILALGAHSDLELSELLNC